ncbi:threonine/homoserine efflux transporter RhtA [Desulfuromonas soudanensis]|uniref:Threonine/homoserine efflux transporter RhtA n=1 Tax=Desulfuromonas soudanensis TaxID=1603606 RepID=A0A0M4D250_9BACT|nr:DMT family transporter [Desulfuromonas soudanensis]ALC17277.1 threonine/homoserine efflux transporter RhtA [Desulfuromonas soudanensis]
MTSSADPDSCISTRRALLQLLAGSICISFSPIFIKLAAVGPDAAGFYRMFFSAASLLLWVAVARVSLKIPRKALLVLILGGLALGVDFMCWHRSIHLVGPGLSTLLGNFQVFFTALFSWLILKQKLSPLFLVALALALGGLLLITGVDLAALDAGYRLGLLLGLATALCYSAYILFIRAGMQHPAVSGVSAMLVISLVCTVFMGIATAASGASFAIPDTASLLSLIAVGVLSTTLGWSLISTALRHTPPTLASLVLLLQPALSFAWDVLIFGRPTSGHEVLGIGLILTAIYLGSRQP